jgi:hypothetical protein
MDDSNSSQNASSPRPTLKLKVGARKPPADIKADTKADTKSAPEARPHDSAKMKAGARWSDDYLNRMQADMDVLRSRR